MSNLQGLLGLGMMGGSLYASGGLSGLSNPFSSMGGGGTPMSSAPISTWGANPNGMNAMTPWLNP